MILKGNCKKCGETVRLDIGDWTLQEAIDHISKWKDGYSCPGHHVELYSPYPDDWKLEEWTLEEGHAPTEEEFLADLQAKFKDVRDTAGMQGLITSFSYGFPDTNDGKAWNFIASPKGKRWYYTND
jgi:hypothetical protein